MYSEILKKTLRKYQENYKMSDFKKILEKIFLMYFRNNLRKYVIGNFE